MSETTIAAGTVLGGTWEIVSLLGKGGMGEVWTGKHARLADKRVAVKFLHLAVQDDAALSRFRREAEIAAKLNHPNIVQVLDYNQTPDGTPYLVLELLEGETLGSRLRRGPMSLTDAQVIVRQIGAALHAAHANGIVHRDLKPENIFLVATPTGEVVKLLDFGISKLSTSSTVKTQDAVLIGTPQYMSPEQALGKNSELDARTDIFATGAIVYEMLAGTPAFAADSIARVVFRVAYEPHPPLLTLKPELSPQAAMAVETALEKDPAKRCPTIETFVERFTGSPLPVSTVAPRPIVDSQHGVATPGAATPDSVLYASTRAPSSPPPPEPSKTTDRGASVSAHSMAYGATAAPGSGSLPAALGPLATDAGRGAAVVPAVGGAAVSSAPASVAGLAVPPRNVKRAALVVSGSVVALGTVAFLVMPLLKTADELRPQEPPAPVATPTPAPPTAEVKPPVVPPQSGEAPKPTPPPVEKKEPVVEKSKPAAPKAQEPKAAKTPVPAEAARDENPASDSAPEAEGRLAEHPINLCAVDVNKFKGGRSLGELFRVRKAEKQFRNDPKELLRQVDILRREIESPALQTELACVRTAMACRLKDVSLANTAFNEIDDKARALKNKVKAACREFDIDL